MRLSVLLSLLPSVLASYGIFEALPSIPEGWTQLSAAPASAPLTLRFHLKTHEAALEEELIQISDPAHVRYGDHHSQQTLLRFTSPIDGAVTTVVDWLKASQLPYDISNDVIKVKLTVSQAESLLKTRYSTFTNEEGKSVVRTLQYSVPSEVKKYLAMVQPTTMFGLRPMHSTHKPPVRVYENDVAAEKMRIASPVTGFSKCNNQTVTVECLAELYGFAGYKSGGRSDIGITGFLEQYAQYADLDTFLKKYVPSAVGANFSVTSINGGQNLQTVKNINDIAEANLDVQYAIGIAAPANATFYTTAGRPPFVPDLDVTTNDSEPYLEFLEFVLKQDKLPAVISTSYGESEQTVPLSYRTSVCNLYARLGARGVSVIFSSGDSGPGWSCLSNDGKNTTKFLPVFPAACPWVTSVGGTRNVEPESAIYFSSGGFSDTWEQPWYQKRAIKTYFKEHSDVWKPFEQYFNKTGRGFPDVAAQANNYQVVLNGSTYNIGGTSASAPAFAGIVTLLNDYRLSVGKKQLGFLNPLLYANPQAFTDITVGKSTGCDGTRWSEKIAGNPGIIKDAGWNAVKGWDPVTGLGTPRWEELKKL
ncbi:peptidase S8/S53 domain-containing protein [Pyronema omphalodes]|nr:peptidase S8/S53 domain-containing protein [Pyronema omphalodes]